MKHSVEVPDRVQATFASRTEIGASKKDNTQPDKTHGPVNILGMRSKQITQMGKSLQH